MPRAAGLRTSDPGRKPGPTPTKTTPDVSVAMPPLLNVTVPWKVAKPPRSRSALTLSVTAGAPDANAIVTPRPPTVTAVDATAAPVVLTCSEMAAPSDTPAVATVARPETKPAKPAEVMRNAPSPESTPCPPKVSDTSASPIATPPVDDSMVRSPDSDTTPATEVNVAWAPVRLSRR